MEASGHLVLELLTQAGSQDAAVLKPAEQQLKSWETQPSFYSILYSICCNQNIDLNVRWLAVINFKNGVDRYWRKNAPSAIQEAEKTQLKQQLISNFNEPVVQIATQLAVLIGKIARLDCPREWPELIPILLHAVRCDEVLYQQRALLTFYHVTKTLASKRLPHDRKVFSELTSNIFGFMHDLWKTNTEKTLQLLSADPQQAMVAMEHSLLTLKILRKLVVHGFKEPSKSSLAVDFLTQVFQMIHTFLQIKQVEQLQYEMELKRQKYITLLTKVLLDTQEMHPDDYVQFIQPTLHIATQYNFTEAGTGVVYERFQVNSLNLMRSILRCETYRVRPPDNCTYSSAPKSPRAKEAHHCKETFFSQDTLREICHRTISRYFPMTTEDLESWEEDPEEFIAEEGGDTWKFCLRPCIENLYQTLVKEYSELLVPVIAQMFTEHRGPIDPENLQAVLERDAVLNAVGQASFELVEVIDFESWIQQELQTYLQTSNPNYRILRRRAIWLLGCFVGMKVTPSLRPNIYELLMPHLDHSDDLVVRLESAATLKALVDDFDFQTDLFLPYLERFFGLLFQLLKDVSECETKMQVLHVMSFLVEQVQRAIRPCAAGLIQYLPSLWDSSAKHDLLRCAILTTLVTLVQGFGASSVQMHDFLLPVIQVATDTTSDPHVYLVEDGLDLWSTTLECAPSITPGLLALYKNIPSLLELGSDYLKTCFDIIEGYIILGPQEFMQNYSSSLVDSLSNLMSDLKTEGIVMVLKVIELVCLIFPMEGPQIFKVMLPRGLQTIIDGEAYPMIVSMYMSIFARLILGNQDFLMAFLNEYAQEQGRQGPELLGVMLDSWVERLDNITEYNRKKLSALALLSLLPNGSQVVLEKFGGIMSVCVETLHDVCNCDEDGVFHDSLLMDSEIVLPDDDYDTEHEKRERRLSVNDPVHRISLRDFLLSQLEGLQRIHGQEIFQQLTQLVDPDVYDQLSNFIK